MQYIVQKKGYRILSVIALAVAVAVLVFIAADSQAGHNSGLLEMDGNTAYNGGYGVNPCAAAGSCVVPPAPSPECGAGSFPALTHPKDCIETQAQFDWEDVCEAGGDGMIKLIDADATQETCEHDFVVGSTVDRSYHTGSDKDFQDTSDPADPTASDVWRCTKAANPLDKNEILNAYSKITSFTPPGGGTPHQVLFGATERDSNNGTAYIGFWFLQNRVTVNTPCNDVTNFSGVHKCGDVLAVFSYEAGGAVGTVAAYNWQLAIPAGGTTPVERLGCDGVAGGSGLNADCPNAPGPGIASQGALCLIKKVDTGDCRVAATFDELCGRNNGAVGCNPKRNDLSPCDGPGAFGTPWLPRNGTCADPTSTADTVCLAFNEFNEGVVDLTALGIEIGCVSTFIAETRSSSSNDATLKDFSVGQFGATCESSVVTEIHNVANHGTGSDPDIQSATVGVVAGTVVHDRAIITVVGPSGAPSATGTLYFDRWEDNTGCTGDPDFTESVTISAPGIPPSTPTGFDSPSTFTTTGAPGISYKARFDANAPYSDSISPCEPLKVVNPTAVVTVPSPSQGHIGDVLNDTATLSGGFNPTGSITFNLYGPGDTTCAGPAVFTQTVSVSGNGSYSTTGGHTTTAAGTYRWTASYSGDTNNQASASGCQDELVLIINPSMAAIKSAAPVATVTYSYTDQNTGDVDLHDLTLDDDKCDPVVGVLQADLVHNIGDVNDDGLVNSGPAGVGETWSFVCTTTITLPINGTAVQNTVTATAYDTLDGVVTDTDSVTVTSTITVTKP